MFRCWNNSFSLFVGNLPTSATTQVTGDLFSRFGKVVDVVRSGLSHKQGSAFGFVRYFNAGKAHRAIDSLDGWVLWGSRLVIKRARPLRLNVLMTKSMGFKTDPLPENSSRKCSTDYSNQIERNHGSL